jgi:SNF2 family DNA or RNA helicase
MSLYKHQLDAAAFAVKNGGKVALFHDPGCGKTLTTLEIFRYYRQQDPTLRMLVVCPLSLINAAWGEDTKKFTDFNYKPYSDATPRDLAGLPDVRTGKTADILGINFESLIVEKRFKEIYAMLIDHNWMLCVDESSRMKNHKSMTTKALLKLASLAKYKIVASGTPAPNSELEFWAQAKFIKPDSFPDSFFAFRNIYFHLGRGNQVMPLRGKVLSRGMMAEIFQNGWKYMITPQNREALMKQLAPFCHWVRKEDALDLPEKIDEIRMVRLNPNERKAYNEMKTHLVAEIRTGRQRGGAPEVTQVVAEVALAKLMKLRQLTSGFAYDENHDAQRPGRSSKMRELEDLLEELGPQQVIIWVQFHEEVERIAELLGDKTYVTLYSGTKDREASIKDFQDGKAQYFIAHPRSAAHGLTFVNCSASVFFSLDYSYEAHAQARDRIHRIGQTKKCLYVYLVAENSIDGMVMDVLNRKKSLQDVFYQLMKEEEA